MRCIYNVVACNNLYLFPKSFSFVGHSPKRQKLDLGPSSTYNSVIIPTPWALAGPYGWLAGLEFYNN